MDTTLVYFLTETVSGTFVLCVCAFASMASGMWVILKIDEAVNLIAYKWALSHSGKLAEWIANKIECRVKCESQKDLLISICREKRSVYHG